MKYNIPIIGFTGPLGSGCTYIARGLEGVTNGKYHYFSLSHIIRKIIKEQDGNDNPSTEQLQNKGNELREKENSGYLAIELMDHLASRKDFDPDGLIIDSIKNEAEVIALKNWPNFFLFAVQADADIRRTRCVDGDRFKSNAEFELADKRDQLEQLDHGQQVKKCDYISDIIIYNNNQIPKYYKDGKDDYIRNIYRRYISLIESSVKGEKSLIKPDVHELCMTVAYSLSKMSSCLKRKVGSVIIENEVSKNTTDNPHHIIREIPFVISSGFNEVPLGLRACIYEPEHQKCYRDFLQESHAQGYKFCPDCGKPINFKVSCECGISYIGFVKSCKHCGKEIDSKYMCECGTHIFDTYLPGGKDSPGKLLDMCRALHAEEMALLRLAKIGGGSNENRILYTTTQPCNLCANKIVASGIKNVVYAEPYSMKESEEILIKGNVNRIRFQGVKSSAYFKLYR
jgi:deoxycytidylate deaminase/dephospho-CoA kinase